MNPSAEASGVIERLRKQIRQGTRVLSLSGLTSVASRAFVLFELWRGTGGFFVVITDLNKDLDHWRCDLDFFIRRGRKDDESLRKNEETRQLLTLPSFEADVYSGVSPHAETQEKRALTLWHLTGPPEQGFLILPAKSLITKVPVPERLRERGAFLRRDEDLPPEELIEKLLSGGYRREEPLANVGEFSTRGGIIDVWSPTEPNPVRIEFFGDTVDSIRTFDPDTQLSIGQIKETSIAPMREFFADAADFKTWAERAAKEFSEERFTRNLKDRTDFAREGESFSGWEFLIPLISPREATIFDYLPSDPVFVIDEPGRIGQTLEEFYEHLHDHYREISDHGEIGLPPERLFAAGDTLRRRFDKNQRLELRSLGKTAAQTDEDISLEARLAEDVRPGAASAGRPPLFLFSASEKSADFELQSRSTRKYNGDFREFAADLKKIDLSAAASGATGSVTYPQILFVFQSPGLAERFNNILRDYEIILPGNLLRIGDLSGGFEIPALELTIYHETEIFGEITQQEFQPQTPVAKLRQPKTSAFISDFRDLKPGDYVVHVDHGIGRFEGLETLETGGVSREFMLLVYADNAKLFVPVERLDLVSRYGSAEGTHPALDRLGGLGWQKTKAKAKRAMRDMADELLRLYAERKLVQGFAFSSDAPWQKEFEEAFPYQLTPDQAVSITDVKTDMEEPVPMDRLIVGDVGYGKTEVAMRAAFKAVMDGRQVAVLTPTTVLSYQHFETFRQRFAAFPVRIELLSRFRTRKQQKEVVAATEKGEVDILIGTHRILSNDVIFKRLGLVIVDEEQRFGVAHKEKLKKLKKKIDVLTLTATPIPRTLNMSLIGMRDMSVIETPPRDRLAINTQVVQFSEGVIRSAIDLELARSGQVFFIHNRVQTIEAIAAHIRRIVPQARIVIGHGQMNEKELEKVMLDFIDYQYDVLVATTIIENGIDIPRANTIIINRADTYGLSQLYQLRGRVGRSSRRAYAYLLIPPELELTPVARRRLSAIREFSDLGAGFRIAALDLELRGAGNILGGQQSGHLDALGFDLYTKMLNRTIQELRGEEIKDESSVSLNLGADVSIPHEYIGDTSQRLRTYKRISSAETEEDLRRIYSEIQDRYGRLPRSVENLFEHARLRKLAEDLRVISIDKTKTGFAVKLSENAKVDPDLLLKFLEKNEGAKFSPSGILQVSEEEGADLLEKARRALLEIAGRV